MKLLRFTCTFIFFLSSIITLKAQSNSYYFEDALMKCYEDTFKDKGVALREFVEKSEKSLSEANILKGISGESYLYYLKNSGKYTSINYKNLGFVNFALNQLSTANFNLNAFKSCKANLEKEEGFQSSKMNQVEGIFKTIETANNVQDVTKKVAEILTPKDLEHIYYRLEIINFMEIHGSKSIKPPNENVTLSETELKNALKIHVKAQDEIIVKNTTVSFGELLQETKTYMQKSTSNALIALKVEEGISKQFIRAIKQQMEKVIDDLQNEAAIKKHQRSFSELTQAEKEEIQKIYPKKIVRANF